MIFDFFTYNNEKDILMLRFSEMRKLNMNISHFLTEGSYTFTGRPRKSAFLSNEDGCIDFHPCGVRIVSGLNDFVVLNDASMPNNGNPWDNEKHQRNFIYMMPYWEEIPDNAIVIISDVDEIPNPEAILSYKPEMGVASLVMDKFSYYLNCREGKQTWTHAKIAAFKHIKDRLPDDVRNGGSDTMIPNGGWHFSYMGGVDRIMDKLNSFSHTEVNTPELNNREVLERKLATCQSLWTNEPGDVWEIVDIDESFPMTIRENPELYSKLIYAKPK